MSIEMDRRALLRAGLAVSVVGAAGLEVPTLAAAAEAAAAPKIYSTADWKARNATSTIKVLNKKSTKVIIHHTATGNVSDTSKAHAFALSKSIQNYHIDHNKWADTGQHFTNSRGGHLTEGRHKSLSSLKSGKTHVVSAHTSGQNEVAVGIENEGTYTSANPPTALWNGLVSLVSYICDQYGISSKKIYGHRDYNSTECPGNKLYAKLPALRKAVAAKLKQVAAAEEEELSWPLLGLGERDVRVRAAQHLLRAQGASDLPADGIFTERTAQAVREFEARHGVTFEPCYATRHESESGLLGAGAWPLLVPTVRPGDRGEAAKAVELLRQAKGQRAAAASAVVDEREWKILLA